MNEIFKDVGYVQVESFRQRKDGKLIIFTNGTFYLGALPHHCDLFRNIKKIYPNSYVVVGVNSAKSIVSIKQRPPIFTDTERYLMLTSNKYIDDVVFFDTNTPLAIITTLNPDIIIKGADYSSDDIIGFPNETAIALTLIKKSSAKSTTEILHKIKKNNLNL